MGLLGVTVSPEYGGLGLGYFDHTLAMEVRKLNLQFLSKNDFDGFV